MTMTSDTREHTEMFARLDLAVSAVTDTETRDNLTRALDKARDLSYDARGLILAFQVQAIARRVVRDANAIIHIVNTAR